MTAAEATSRLHSIGTFTQAKGAFCHIAALPRYTSSVLYPRKLGGRLEWRCSAPVSRIPQVWEE